MLVPLSIFAPFGRPPVAMSTLWVNAESLFTSPRKVRFGTRDTIQTLVLTVRMRAPICSGCRAARAVRRSMPWATTVRFSVDRRQRLRGLVRRNNHGIDALGGKMKRSRIIVAIVVISIVYISALRQRATHAGGGSAGAVCTLSQTG